LNADRVLIPDVAELRERLIESFSELLALTRRSRRAASNVAFAAPVRAAV
jgi:hypothetical protein